MATGIGARAVLSRVVLFTQVWKELKPTKNTVRRHRQVSAFASAECPAGRPLVDFTRAGAVLQVLGYRRVYGSARDLSNTFPPRQPLDSVL
jgi:hypothetical protein